MMVAPKDVETVRRAAGAEGARRRPAPDPGDAAAVGRRHHRPHQGELPQPHRAAGRVAASIRAPSSISTGAETLLGNGDMLFSDRGHQAAPHPRRVPVRRRGASRGRLPQAAGQAGLRHGHPQAARGGRTRRARPPTTSTTSSTIRRSRSCATRARRRSRTSSAGCRSATTARRAWSSRWSATASSARPTAPSRARCWRRRANIWRRAA